MPPTDKNKESDPTAEFYKDFITAKSKFKNIAPNKINTHFSSKYVTLDTLLDHVKEVLAEYNITYQEQIISTVEYAGVGAKFIHRNGHTLEAGQYIFSAITVDSNGAKIPLNVQKITSGITYARRSLLCTACGISVDTDDDGNSASGVAKGYKAPAAPIPSAGVPANILSVIPAFKQANAVKFCISKGWLKEGQELTDLEADKINLILSNTAAFLSKF